MRHEDTQVVLHTDKSSPRSSAASQTSDTDTNLKGDSTPTLRLVCQAPPRTARQQEAAAGWRHRPKQSSHAAEVQEPPSRRFWGSVSSTPPPTHAAICPTHAAVEPRARSERPEPNRGQQNSAAGRTGSDLDAVQTAAMRRAKRETGAAPTRDTQLGRPSGEIPEKGQGEEGLPSEESNKHNCGSTQPAPG